MKRILAVLGLVLFSCLGAVAQNRSITGTVADADNKGVVSATIKVKGVSISTVTDFDGKFTVSVPAGKATLAVSSIGFISKAVEVAADQSSVNIVLAESTQELGEVVVTALGIKKQKKSLGYAVQEIKGQSLVEAREPNIANALSGKVAGLQVVKSSAGPGGSSKLVLRGFNSLTGDNQPLIVVDGVPMDNFTGASNNDYWNPSFDMGNGISDINPEDIESLSVLKGPSASALYGSRAGNGVILITTKSGKKQKGLGITVSSSLGFESIFTKPKLQSSYGQGNNNLFEPLSGLSWGPKIEGQNVTNWNGATEQLRSYDNVENYFNTAGITKNNSISFQQAVQKTSIYASLNRMEDESMIPGARLARTNLMAKALTKFGNTDRWTLDTKVQYTNAKANNRTSNGANSSNPFSLLNVFPTSLDITQFKDATDANGKMLWYGSSNSINPYWANKYKLNQDVRDRFMMNASLKYEVNNWLNAEIKGGADMYTNTTYEKTYAGSPIAPNTGRYGTSKGTFMETNYQALLIAKKDDLFGKFGGMATLGGNLMDRKSSSLIVRNGELLVPDYFSVKNFLGNTFAEENIYNKSINSVFGSAQINYDGYLYLDATFRNDWSSSLSKANRSFFYPSLSLSYVFTDMLNRMDVNLPDWFSYGKLRASYASVGNDLEPYQLYNVYYIDKDPNGNLTSSRGKTLFDPNVKSELIKSTEFGAELRFFKSRLGLDVSVYKSNATNQLINLPMDPLSGYNFKKINAGDIQNSGVEVTLDGKILTDANSLTWNTQFNFSTNKSKIVSLYQDVLQYPLGGFDNVSVFAEVGKAYGEIYGSQFLRVADKTSPSFGEIIVDNNGLPLVDSKIVRLGNQQAKAMLGFTNSFAYKAVSLSFQIDARIGGEIFSGTLAGMQLAGTSSETVVNGLRTDMVANGVVMSGNSYVQNAKAVSPQLYWNRVAGSGNLGVTEANIYDASNIRLRNVQLNYNFPSQILSKIAVQKAQIGFSCNNVWMIKSHMNGLDPESVYATGTNAVGFENGGAPTTRTFLMNLTLSF